MTDLHNADDLFRGTDQKGSDMKFRICCVCFLTAVFIFFAGHDLSADGLTGKRAPEIHASTWVNSTGAGIKQLKGNIIVLEFWSIYCPPCRKAMPHMVKLHDKYKERNVAFIGLTSDENTSAVKTFLEKHGVTYPIGVHSSSSTDYGVRGIPHVFLINTKGTVVWEGHPNSKSFEKELKKLSTSEGTAAKTDTPKVSKKEALAVLETSGSKVGEITSDAAKASDFLEKAKGFISYYAYDEEIGPKTMNIIGEIVFKHKNNDIKVEAVSMMKHFKLNDRAAGFLMKSIHLFASRGKQYEELTIQMLRTLPLCAPYSSQAASSLGSLFSGRYDISTKVKKQIVESLGEIRTVASIQTLISLMPKVCPYPEEPNPYIHDLWGDQSKHILWQQLFKPFYNSLNSLTGEKQRGDAFDGNYWKYSTWKRWLRKNGRYYAKKFYNEQKEAMEKKKKEKEGKPF